MYAELCGKLWSAINTVKSDERGVTAIEYAILAALIIAAVSLAVSELNLGGIFSTIHDRIVTAMGT